MHLKLKKTEFLQLLIYMWETYRHENVVQYFVVVI